MPGKNTSLTEKAKSFFQANESTLSTVLGALVVIIIGVLILNYFRSNNQVQEITQEAAEVAESDNGEIELMTDESGREVPKNLPEKHTVSAGEKLWDVAAKYYGSGYNWVDIASANELANPDVILEGQELVLPQTEVRKPVVQAEAQTITGDTYKVQKGDNLWNISVRAYNDGYAWVKIAEANSLSNPNLIEVDQELKIPQS